MMNAFNERVTFYPSIQNIEGQQVPDYDNAVEYPAEISYKNHWEIDGSNVNQYRIELKLNIPADAIVTEGWRVAYDANEYTVWQVEDALSSGGTVLFKVVSSG